jgi:hypothetical protein
MKKYIFVLVLIFVFLFSFQVYAHSGGTDSAGGHYDHYNNEYHYHHGNPAHDHPDGECPYFKNKSDSNESEQFGFWASLFISAFAGWLGGALLLSVLFFPLSLFFYDFLAEHLELIQLICSILVSIAMFVFVYILN